MQNRTPNPSLLLCSLFLLFQYTLMLRTAEAQIAVGKTSQVSLSLTGGTPAGGASYSPDAGANRGGLAFESGATNLVENDTNQQTDAFFTDLKTGKLARASISTAGVEGDGSSSDPSISPVQPDGFYAIAFQSRASYLASISVPSGNPNIFIRFPTLNITELISAVPGFTATLGSSYAPSITVVPQTNGKYKILIAFVSDAPDLVAGDNNGFVDVFLATLEAPDSALYVPTALTTITRITKAATPGQEPDGHCSFAEISADGRYIVFASRATNLVSPAIINDNQDFNVYRYDIQSNVTTLVSKSTLGAPGTGNSTYPQISYTGRYIGYFTVANNIVGNATSNPLFPFVVRYDADTDTNVQVNLASDGVTSGLGNLPTLGISTNGRLITFGDASDVLVPGDSNGKIDIFVKDMETGSVARLSNGANGEQSNQDSLDPTLTAKTLNGLTYGVAFDSLATNLTSPPTASQFTDVYTTSFDISIPPLSGTTKLETPPDVTLTNKNISVSAQSFVATTPSSQKHPQTVKAIKQEVRYEFSVSRTFTKGTKRQTTRSTLISKRNTITFGRSPGTYAIKNRVNIVNPRTNKAILKTAFSPTQTVTIAKR
jgi:hypothetical protein